MTWSKLHKLTGLKCAVVNVTDIMEHLIQSPIERVMMPQTQGYSETGTDRGAKKAVTLIILGVAK